MPRMHGPGFARLLHVNSVRVDLDDTVYLYDLTSSYFEGLAKRNPQAKRGYSRDKRPDCKQVVVGLVLDRDGFPKAHEVFDGKTCRIAAPWVRCSRS